MKLGMFSTDSRGVVKMVPLSDDELHSFVPTMAQLVPDVQEIDPPYEYVRVAPLVWVDVKNIDGGVAMVLPVRVSDYVAKHALSAAWREWQEKKREVEELEKEFERIAEELEGRREHFKMLADQPLRGR